MKQLEEQQAPPVPEAKAPAPALAPALQMVSLVGNRTFDYQ